MAKKGYVYILASKKQGTLYIGVTSNLLRRVEEHKTGAVQGFTKRYRVDRLVYYETCDSIIAAIAREKRLKRWNRAWKISLIDRVNPRWRDLVEDFY